MPDSVSVRSHVRDLEYFKRLKVKSDKSLDGFENRVVSRVVVSNFWENVDSNVQIMRVSSMPSSSVRDEVFLKILGYYSSLGSVQGFPGSMQEIIDSTHRFYVILKGNHRISDVTVQDVVGSFALDYVGDKSIHFFVMDSNMVSLKKVNKVVFEIAQMTPYTVNNLNFVFNYNNVKLFKVLKKTGFVGTQGVNGGIFSLDLSAYQAFIRDRSSDDDGVVSVGRVESVI